MSRKLLLAGGVVALVAAEAVLFGAGWARHAALLVHTARVEQVLAEAAESELTGPDKPSDDPKARMEQLLQQSPELREIENAWRAKWLTDQPSHLARPRVHGDIGP